MGVQTVGRKSRVCSVEDCASKAHARGWCKKHWQAWKNGNPPGPVIDLRHREPRFCPIDDCGKPAKGRGLCAMHYARWQQNGDPRVARGYRMERVAMSSGYYRVWKPGHPLAAPDNYVLEHRLVLWEAGIDPRGHVVHHINHDRGDNRLENLELKTNAGHASDHVQERGWVKNQYGEWPVRRSVCADA